MITGKIISRYIFREMLPPFGLCILFFTFLFLMAEMTKIVNWGGLYGDFIHAALSFDFCSAHVGDGGRDADISAAFNRQ